MQQLVGLLSKLQLKKGARLLIMGKNSTQISNNLSSQNFIIEIQEDAEKLRFPDAFFDAAIVVGMMEHVQWDRWILQNIHRVLKNDAPLILSAPNLFRLNPLHIASEFIKRVDKFSRKLLKISNHRLQKGVRSYNIPRLINRIKSVGYEITETFPGSIYFLICKKKPSLFGLETEKPFPDRQMYKIQFETAHKHLVEIREKWLAKNPRYKPKQPQALDMALYSKRNVVVLAPHPDDEIIGCGGTLLKLSNAGAHITIVHATDGASSAALVGMPDSVRKTIRLEHAQNIFNEAGFDEILFWKEPSSYLECNLHCIKTLTDTLNRLKPALIFVPFVKDTHPDHVVLNFILSKALQSTTYDINDTNILSYEVWSLNPNNTYCDITNVMKKKEALLFKYSTEMRVDDYVHNCEALHFYNSTVLTQQNGFVEGFFAVKSKEYCQLIAEESHG